MIKQFYSNNLISISHLFALSLNDLLCHLFSQFKCQTVLFDPSTGPSQVLPLQTRVDLGAIAMKGYSRFPKAPALQEPHNQMVKCHIHDTHGVCLTPLVRSSQCILQGCLLSLDFSHIKAEFVKFSTYKVLQYSQPECTWSKQSFLINWLLYIFLKLTGMSRMSYTDFC